MFGGEGREDTCDEDLFNEDFKAFPGGLPVSALSAGCPLLANLLWGWIRFREPGVE